MPTVVRLVGFDQPPPNRYTLLSGHPASEHQARVFDAAADPRSGSKIVRAVAGSGKTTVVVNALRYFPAGATIQGFAFNTDAGANLRAGLADLRERDGEARYAQVRMDTFHSVGFRALARFRGWSDVKPDRGKTRKILKQRLVGDDNDRYASFVTKLVGYAKGEGIGALVPDVEGRWYALVEHHGMTLDHEEADEARAVEIARKTLAFSTRVAYERHWVDFDDLLYLVLKWKLSLFRNDVVLVDEAQDSNPVRRAFARLAMRRDGRLFAVGDPNQSIYGFTGATPDAMDVIARDFDATELPLTVSYRCARAIVDRARAWVPDMSAFDGAPEGLVEFDVDPDAALAVLTDDDLVLCRRTAPLVDLAYGIVARGRACRVAGKAIGEDLADLVRAQRTTGLDRLLGRLTTYEEREVARAIALDDDERAEAVRDRVACVRVIAERLPEPERTVPGLLRRIDATFSDDEDRVLRLMTCHRAKGLEADRVAVLRPDLLPSPSRQEWGRVQEDNLCYVTTTRARNHLMYLAV